MMEKDNEQLLKQFFAESKQEPADNGFSRRVMHHLPDRENRIAKIWSYCCFTLAAVLFVALDGFHLLLNALRETFEKMLESGLPANFDPTSYAIAALVLLFLAYRKIASLA